MTSPRRRSRFRSPTAVDATPDQYLDCVMLEAEFAAAGGPTNYSLALDAAAVAVSVQSVAVLRGRTLALDTSALAVEPQALALSRGRTLALDAVAVAIAGQPVTPCAGDWPRWPRPPSWSTSRPWRCRVGGR